MPLVLTNTFQLFFGIFLALLTSPLARTTKLTAGSWGTKIQVERADVSAVAKTLVFTVFVPGTVAGYVPWRLNTSAGARIGAGGMAGMSLHRVGVGSDI